MLGLNWCMCICIWDNVRAGMVGFFLHDIEDPGSFYLATLESLDDALVQAIWIPDSRTKKRGGNKRPHFWPFIAQRGGHHIPPAVIPLARTYSYAHSQLQGKLGISSWFWVAQLKILLPRKKGLMSIHVFKAFSFIIIILLFLKLLISATLSICRKTVAIDITLASTGPLKYLAKLITEENDHCAILCCIFLMSGDVRTIFFSVEIHLRSGFSHCF